jgi:hypothetical protein
LVGSNGGVISSCYATGKVKGDHGFEAAGLVGNNGSQIINSYATGSAVGGPSAEVGGLVADNEAYVSTSYSTGNVSAGSRGTVGGLVGLNDVNLGITGSYWDTKTSGTDVGIGAGSTSGATGLTTKQFKAGLPSGFDPTIWAQSPSINKGFPYLLANPPQ